MNKGILNFKMDYHSKEFQGERDFTASSSNNTGSIGLKFVFFLCQSHFFFLPCCLRIFSPIFVCCMSFRSHGNMHES